MQLGFWNTIEKPIVALAPMADVTDPAYRRVIAARGTPDVMWTEFVSADGLYHTREMQQRPDDENPLMIALQYTQAQRPIVAQLFSPRPEMMEYGARLVARLGFDGLDINMGCPDKAVVKQGSGAGHIRDKAHAQEVIRAAMRGAPDIPVSVKTRIGDTSNELAEWVPAILETQPAALTMHARTRAELSKVPARWETVAQTVAIRDELGSKTLVLGNGDVTDVADGLARARESGADGVMMGKAIFGNPWLFANVADVKQGAAAYTPSQHEKLVALLELTELFHQLLPHKNPATLKKHVKAFVTGWDGARQLRDELMAAPTLAELAQRLRAEIAATSVLT